MSVTPETMPRPPRVPLAVLGAALVSLAALGLTAQNSLPLLWALAFVFGASYFWNARIPDNSRTHLPLLILGGLIAYALTPPETPGTYDQIGPAKIRNVIAQIYACEMAIQFFRLRNSSGDTRQSPLLILLFSGLMFLSASNTYDDRFIRFVAPLYLLFVAGAFVSYRLHPAQPSRQITPRLLQIGAFFLAFGLGGGVVAGTNKYRGNLAEITNRLTGFAPPPRLESTGMASQPHLGPLFGLRGTPVRILRINNFSGDPHWHGIAFDTYHSGSWGPDVTERRLLPTGDKALQPPEASRVGGTETVLVTRLVSENPLVYFPLTTVDLDKGEVGTLQGNLPQGGPLRTPRRTPAPFDYTISVAPTETYQGLWAAKLSGERREAALQIPDELNSAIPLLAQKIVGSETSDQKKANAVVAYLLNAHPYSLNFRPEPNKFPDPLADFLLSTPAKGAHCEFFATASCVLLRCVGVPTRYVTGYFAHESAGEGVTIVRQRDAHAWCEAWINGIGWVVVEATPASGRPDGMDSEVEWWRQITEWVQDKLRVLSDFIASLTQKQTIAAVSVLVVLSLLYAAYQYRRAQKRRAALAAGEMRAYSPPPPDLAALSASFESLWAQKTGVPVPRELPYREFLERASLAAPPALYPVAQAWVQHYDRARFGAQQNPDDLSADLHALRDLLRQMEQMQTQKTTEPMEPAAS